MTATEYDIEPATLTDSEDTQPPIEGVEYPCVVCGQEAGPYGGRGRKPRYCPEHKRQSNTGASKRSASGRDRAEAERAANVLVMVNKFAGLGVGVMGMSATQDAIVERQDDFYEPVVKALESDPQLRKIILKGGVMSGRAQLIVAYAMLAMGVAPVAKMELDMIIAERKREREANSE